MKRSLPLDRLQKLQALALFLAEIANDPDAHVVHLSALYGDSDTVTVRDAILDAAKQQSRSPSPGDAPA